MDVVPFSQVAVPYQDGVAVHLNRPGLFLSHFGPCLSALDITLMEEICEFEAEVENMDKDKAEAEFGDVMFSLINAARLYKINPDNALERTNQKFIRRFNYLEEHTIQEGINLKDMTLEEMDAIWNEAKKKGL